MNYFAIIILLLLVDTQDKVGLQRRSADNLPHISLLKSQITHFDMHRPVSRISFLLHFVSIILTLLHTLPTPLI